MSLRRVVLWTVAVSLLTVAGSPVAGAHGADCGEESTGEVALERTEVAIYAPPEDPCAGAMAHDDRLDCKPNEGHDAGGSHGHAVDGAGCWTGFVVKESGSR